MAFFTFLSLVFYKRVVIVLLLPGHSHMAVDRVVSCVRRSLGRNNLYIPSQLIEKINSVQNTEAVYIPDFDLYTGFSGFLKKHLNEMPFGYTKYYYFEFFEGYIFYKVTADTLILR